MSTRTRSRSLSFLALALLPVTACSAVDGGGEEFRPEGAPPPTVTPDDAAADRIRSRDIARHVAFLASDERRGRGTPSDGLTRSAAWLSTQLQAAGVEPAGDNGGYLQYWPYERGADADSVHADTVVQVPNVVGRLPGADLTRAGEYVVVLAHYDHLGVGEPDEDGDSIYNGADDNASGVAALVEVAEAFGALERRPARPVLFLAVSGEEHGLLGSTWFARNPTVFLADAVAALNMDMIGRNHPDSIAVVGYGHSGLGPLVSEVLEATPELGLHLAADPGGDMFRRSDQFAFARRGIPGVHFFSGLHDDYHRPSDEAGALDPDKVARVARLVFLTAHRLADQERTPEWTAEGREAIPR